jgi:hypothetical protein
MTVPTRRQLMAGSLAAVGVAGAPAVAIAAAPTDPAARIEYHLRELERAMREYYPGATINASWNKAPPLGPTAMKPEDRPALAMVLAYCDD